ncbi:MAG: DNA polymerase III subunit gamma/tau [candidate division KSB1 bacterium]|nr:DNA polymerase III subunit gamma/tau [candidate division KSB1 bacterium]
MSYQVLARKYRPMFFEDVVGQEHVTQTLQNAIRQNRIANAYLFCGPRGVGKTTVARLLSKAVNCDHGPTVRPCNECPSCIEINESRSLDVLEIDGASNRGIDEVRNLRESLRYAPNPGKSRIYIIDEVHMLTTEAFNALLKSLEEPPPRVLFIFATTEVHKVPTTIVSRCQRFDFKRIPIRRIIEQLRELCAKEEIVIDDESLRMIAEKGDGSMRDAESILDQVIAFAGKTITNQQVAELLGVIGLPLFFEVTDIIRRGDSRAAVDLVQRIFTEGYDFAVFLNGLAEHLRNVLVVKVTGNTDELTVADEFAHRYLQLSAEFQTEDLLRLIKMAVETESLMRRSSNARLHLETALIKMTTMTSSVQLSELVAHLQEAKKKSPQPKLTPSVSNTPRPEATAPLLESPAPMGDKKSSGSVTAHEQAAEAGPPLTLEQIEAQWPAVLEAVKSRAVAVAAALIEGWPVRLSASYLEIGFAGRNGFHQAAVERHSRSLEEILQERFGRRLRIRCVEVSEETLRQVRKVTPVSDKKEEFERLKAESDLVRTIVDLFDAEFIK